MTIAKRSDRWTTRKCKQCGKEFEIRKCYVRRGQGKFCSTSCVTTYRNLRSNPSKKPEVRRKISKNHADVSGKNNPMHGMRGSLAPGYIDGRNKIRGDPWRKIALTHKERVCELCGGVPRNKRNLHVHHKDGNRKNNDLENLQVVCVWCHNNILHKRQRDEFGRFVSEEVV